MSFENIFFHSIDCLLVLSIVSFAVQKLFILMRSQYFIFAFISLAFEDMSSKKLLWLRSKQLLPVFSFGVLMVSYLTFSSFIHFEFIFCVWCKKVVQVHSSACHCPVFPAPLAEETVFIPLGTLSCFVED